MIKKSTNIYLLTTITTIAYLVAIIILDYIRGNFDLAQIIVGAIVFWVVYFVTVKLFIRWRQK